MAESFASEPEFVKATLAFIPPGYTEVNNLAYSPA
jgi:hypothetical protein